MKKRTFSTLIVLTMVMGTLPSMAYADTITSNSPQLVYESGALTLSANTAVADNDYFTWTDSDDEDSLFDTLTLKQDMEITTDSGAGITLSDGGTIDLGVYDLTITTSDNLTGYGIGSVGDLTITGTGTLNIISDGDNDGIYANTDITITITNATVNTNTIYATTGNVSIKDGAEVNTDYYIAMDNSSATFTLTDATCNGLLSIGNVSDGYTETFYGDFTIETSDQALTMFDGSGTLAFAENSTLTIDEDVAVDWSDYTTITWENASLINNGILILPTNTAIADLGITGDGYIVIDGAYYNNDGTITGEYSDVYDDVVADDESDFTDVSASKYYYNAVLWAVENGITSGTTATTFAPNATCTRAQAVVFLYRAAGEPEVSGELAFTDVSADAYYYNAVLWAVENGITSGTTATTFSPEADCTRSQIVAFLWNNAGKPVVNYAMDFEDVADDKWYAEAVRWSVSEGITAGTTETTFQPEALCNRGQIVTFLYRNMAE